MADDSYGRPILAEAGNTAASGRNVSMADSAISTGLTTPLSGDASATYHDHSPAGAAQFIPPSLRDRREINAAGQSRISHTLRELIHSGKLGEEANDEATRNKQFSTLKKILLLICCELDPSLQQDIIFRHIFEGQSEYDQACSERDVEPLGNCSRSGSLAVPPSALVDKESAGACADLVLERETRNAYPGAKVLREFSAEQETSADHHASLGTGATNACPGASSKKQFGIPPAFAGADGTANLQVYFPSDGARTTIAALEVCSVEVDSANLPSVLPSRQTEVSHQRVEQDSLAQRPAVLPSVGENEGAAVQCGVSEEAAHVQLSQIEDLERQMTCLEIKMDELAELQELLISAYLDKEKEAEKVARLSQSVSCCKRDLQDIEKDIKSQERQHRASTAYLIGRFVHVSRRVKSHEQKLCTLEDCFGALTEAISEIRRNVHVHSPD